MHAQTRSFENRLQKGCGRSLPVCPRDMHDERQTLMQIPELGQKALNTPQRQVDQFRVQGLQLCKELAASGVLAHLVSTPVYFRSGVSQRRWNRPLHKTFVCDIIKMSSHI